MQWPTYNIITMVLKLTIKKKPLLIDMNLN